MQQSEKDLLDLLDHAVFVIEPDVEGEPRYAHVNRVALMSSGMALEDVIGKTARDLFAPPLGESSYQLHKRVLHSGEAERYEVFKPRCGVTALVPQVSGGRVVRLIGSIRTSDDPSMVADLEKTAEARQRDLQNFVHLAAHDLRTPMRQVGTLAELLRDGTDDPDQIALIEMLEGLSENALSLIGDILSHADVTGTPEQVSLFQLDTLMQGIASLVDPLGRVTLQLFPLSLEMDRAALLVVLRNLFDNAVKYAWPEDIQRPPVLSIKVETGRANLLIFTVEDNGVGLSSDRLRLFRGEARAETGRFGVMAIRALITSRGGWVDAENRREGGARIRFALPGAMASGGVETETPGAEAGRSGHSLF